MSNLKYIKLLVLVVFIFSASTHSKAQNLLDSLEGKWKVIEHKTKSKLKAKSDIITFQSNGTYLSDSSFLNSTKGFFRTDENRSIVLTEANGVEKEWHANLINGKLTLKEVNPKKKTSKSMLTLTRVTPNPENKKSDN